MPRYILLVLSFLTCVIVFYSCDNRKSSIKEQVGKMSAEPILVNLDNMDYVECRSDSFLPETEVDYTMVVYVDSSKCTPCAIDHLRFWNKHVKDAKYKKLKITFKFIVAPKEREKEDVYMTLAESDLLCPIYVDTAYTFLKNNPMIPKDKMYHSFLLGKDNKVLLVGSPIDNERVKEIYERIINPK